MTNFGRRKGSEINPAGAFYLVRVFVESILQHWQIVLKRMFEASTRKVAN